MHVLKTVKEIREVVSQAKQNNKTIGFVPTMGYLHQGHLSLMKKAKDENDLVIISIFVNPTQFGPNEDLDTYPRDLDGDVKLAESVGVQVVFAPESDEIYPPNYQTYVEVSHLGQNLCGAKRPGHFRGVCTVVTKLFNIVQPDQAYFGQKDAQQAIIIRQVVADLNIPVEIVVCPIAREKDGLAMSSRNKYLNIEERQTATVLNQALLQGKELVLTGERNAEIVEKLIIDILNAEPLAKIDYVSIVSARTLQSIKELTGTILIALGVFVGKTRLIDNIMMEVE